MKLLVAVDLKKDAHFVILASLPWATQLGCTVDLLYADAFRSYGADSDDQQLNTEYERMAKEDLRDLTALLVNLPAELRGRPLIAAGDPATIIVDRAAGYDLVLVATSGRTGLMAFVLGSVAEQVVRYCPKPVLVVRYAAD